MPLSILTKDHRDLSRQILDISNTSISRVDFLNNVSKLVSEFIGCDAMELWLKEENRYVRTVIKKQAAHAFHYENIIILTYF